MKFLAIIQARCGSTRLPNKVLKDICGQSQIVRVIERVKQSKYVDKVIVATSIDENNLPLIKECVDHNVQVFAGSENDVLDRFYQASKLFKPEYVIRITADCPLYDTPSLDKAIEQLKDYDYISDMGNAPDGMDIEVFKFEALKKAWENANLASEREHVTIYIKSHPEMFKLGVFNDNSEYKDLRLTVDTQEDYELILNIYKELNNFWLEDIVKVLKKKPELLQINNMYERNEGLIKSLKEDRIVEKED